MTKSAYHYPPDEFDVAVPGGAPVGVHRAPRSGWSSAWPFLLVAVVCAAVAWGGITLLSGGDDSAEGSGDASPSASAPVDPSGEPSGEPSGGASGEPSGEPSGGGEGSAPPEQSAEELVGAMDPAATYMVFNTGGTVNQLAGTTATNLEAGGVANIEVSTDTAPEGADVTGLTANTVWYGEGREAEGKALAAVLGIPESNVVMNETVSSSAQAAWVFMFTPPA